MSWLLKFNWNPLTPGRLPAGARISAGKSGKVLMSLPSTAEVLVNCVPVSCIPSPESPAKRIATDSSSSKCPLLVSGDVEADGVTEVSAIDADLLAREGRERD